MIRIHALAFVDLARTGCRVRCAVVGVVFQSAHTESPSGSAALGADEPAGHGEGAYFTKELVATRAQIDILAKDGPDVPLAGLLLRAAYLDLERDFAQGRQHDPAFWTNVQERVDALRIAHAPPAPVADPAGEQAVGGDREGNDSQSAKNLIDAQVSTINELKEALAALLGEHGHGAEMIDQVDKLGRTNREMALCVSILEDDNSFLRDKLKQAGIEME